MSITEVLVQPQAITWLPWAVQYFFYIGSAYAAAILFLLALLFDAKTSHRVRSALVLTLAISAIVGPLALTADLHQPGRAWHFYTNLTPWSWMSLGSLFLPLFSGLSVLTAWLYLRQDLMNLEQQPGKVNALLAKLSLGRWVTSHKMMLSVSIATVLSGLSIALYTGAEIAVVQSRSLWNQPESPLIWFVTAFLGAVGFALFIWLLMPNKSQGLSTVDTRLLRQAISISALLALLLVPVWASNNASFDLYSDPIWLRHIVVMASLLVACAVIPRFVLRDGKKNLIGIGLLSATTLITAWVIRWNTIMEVQTIAKFDVGPYPYHLPTDSNGLLGIVGMFGLWIALALLSSELIGPNRNTSSFSPVTKH
ncbi:NrfD/PsrC family molybdoenzyme membrane anchor subunit [Vibrio ezurae]|uniref:Tetrathionate reductase subunit C n=1 Tax=Vibrio ezurae NBRC 102218 TaxID=1219080 RepID=U3CMS3_9VIBR|nr:NrfD/PsrC family molybdoenzyme membrane anchor subunit [Vibrio ezurae]GAD79418.1 hypothetical protein VEZ01S_12_00130 [Vibrio ezurae NBRC 102218]